MYQTLTKRVNKIVDEINDNYPHTTKPQTYDQNTLNFQDSYVWS